MKERGVSERVVAGGCRSKVAKGGAGGGRQEEGWQRPLAGGPQGGSRGKGGRGEGQGACANVCVTRASTSAGPRTARSGNMWEGSKQHVRG